MRMPRAGLGTWHMGESRARRAEEVDALVAGLDLGMSLVDTAEMYGNGGAEEVVREAIRGRREGVFLVSKFYPHHASRAKLVAACDASLARLGVERLDCYLYHWRGSVPLAETVTVLGELVAAGKIASWGVSNFDVADLEELVAIPGGEKVAANQVLYHLGERGVEFDLLPWCARHGVDVMAYSPLAEGRLPKNGALAQVATRIGAPPAEVALAWLLRDPNVAVIPKAARLDHLRSNRRALDLTLDRDALAALDRAFPPPRRKTALAMI
jgi:diketogulonate reductase-like aldo/keto reductase